MSDTLSSVAADVVAWDARRARSRQTQPGASSTFGCRAETVLRGTGVRPSDPRLSWPAVVGTAIHAVLEQARAREGRVNEHLYVYRGVKCTVDELDPPTLRDFKTREDAAAIATVRRDGPKAGQIAQVMLGAAAAREAGHEVTTVELVFLPRAGDLTDGWVWSAPFDQQIADEAADWHEQVRGLISERTGWEPSDVAEGLRDQPLSWCRVYCPFVTVCRGELPAPVVDEGVRDVAAEYLEAKALEAEAKSRADKARRFLEDYTDLRGVGLQWSGGNVKTVEEDDVELARMLLGADWPTRIVEKVTPRTLRRVK